MHRSGPLLLTLTLVLCKASIAQNTSSLDSYWNVRDYSGLIENAEKMDSLSDNDWVLLAQAYYQESEIEKTRTCIRMIDKKGIVNSRVQIIRKDIDRNQVRKTINDDSYLLSKINHSSKQSHFASYIDDSVFYITISSAETSQGIQNQNTGFDTYGVYKGTGELNEYSNFQKVVKSANRHRGPIIPYKGGYWLTENYSSASDRKFLKLSLLDAEFKYVKDFTFSNTHYSTGHACFDSIAERLYFVSDMPKGNGNTNLWYSQLSPDGSWKAPIFLSNINTDGQEMFPTISEGYLYFSSNGRDGYGGLDLFRINLRSGDRTIEHLPAPLNSRADDFGIFWLNADQGYVNSNRSADGLDYVYSITQETGQFGCVAECENESCRNFVIDGLIDLDPLRYTFHWDFGDGNSADNWFPVHCYADTGYYEVRLAVRDLVSGVIDSNVFIRNIHILNNTRNNPSFSIDRVVKSKPFTPNLSGEFNKEEIKKSLWKSSAGDYSFEAAPQFVIDSVGWHWIEQSVQVDRIDSCCHNSFRRYFYVFDEDLIGNEIGQTSAEVGGNAVTFNPALNPNFYVTELLFSGIVDGEPIRLLLKNNLGTVIVDTVSTVNPVKMVLSHDQTYQLETKNIFGVTVLKEITSIDKTEASYRLNQIEIPPYRLEGVQFSSGSSAISNESAKILDGLVEILLSQPKLIVELSAHTDSRGSNQANQSLSERRAKSVETYLIKKGVTKGQLQSIGYGESKLSNNCADGVECSSQDHKQNRRVEVRIVKLRK